MEKDKDKGIGKWQKKKRNQRLYLKESTLFH